MKHMRYTSTCFFLDAYVIWMKIFTLSTSQGVGILFPMVTLHTTALIYIYLLTEFVFPSNMLTPLEEAENESEC